MSGDLTGLCLCMLCVHWKNKFLIFLKKDQVIEVFPRGERGLKMLKIVIHNLWMLPYLFLLTLHHSSGKLWQLEGPGSRPSPISNHFFAPLHDLPTTKSLSKLSARSSNAQFLKAQSTSRPGWHLRGQFWWARACGDSRFCIRVCAVPSRDISGHYTLAFDITDMGPSQFLQWARNKINLEDHYFNTTISLYISLISLKELVYCK